MRLIHNVASGQGTDISNIPKTDLLFSSWFLANVLIVALCSFFHCPDEEKHSVETLTKSLNFGPFYKAN